MTFGFGELLSGVKDLVDSPIGKSVAAMAGPYGMAAAGALSAAPGIASKVAEMTGNSAAYSGTPPIAASSMLQKAATGSSDMLASMQAIMRRQGATAEQANGFTSKDMAVGARLFDNDQATRQLVERVQKDPSASHLLGRATISVLTFIIANLRRDELALAERRAMFEYQLKRAMEAQYRSTVPVFMGGTKV